MGEEKEKIFTLESKVERRKKRRIQIQFTIYNGFGIGEGGERREGKGKRKQAKTNKIFSKVGMKEDALVRGKCGLTLLFDFFVINITNSLFYSFLSNLK